MTTEEFSEDARDRETQAWARWLGRGIDGVLLLPAAFAAFFAIGVGVELGRLPRVLLEWSAEPIGSAIIGAILTLILFWLWEPLFLWSVGTTPGKWVMGIRVRDEDGANPSFVRALWRTIYVWVGLALGIPLLAAITALVARSQLVADGVTAWDSATDLTVTHRRRPAILWAVMIVFVIGVNVGVQVWDKSSR